MTPIDPRLGKLRPDQTVEYWPTQYPHGAPFEKLHDDAPTRFHFSGTPYFVVLPMRVGGLDDATRDELLAIVGKGNQPAPVTPLTSPVSPPAPITPLKPAAFTPKEDDGK